jgi:hypothetical protein
LLANRRWSPFVTVRHELWPSFVMLRFTAAVLHGRSELAVGEAVGAVLGDPVGNELGAVVLGDTDGPIEGETVGATDGPAVGCTVGPGVSHKLHLRGQSSENPPHCVSTQCWGSGIS